MTALVDRPRVAIVSGASSGIGLAVMRQLMARGGIPIGIDINPLPASLVERGAIWARGSVTDPQVWRSAVEISRIKHSTHPQDLILNAAVVTVGDALETPLSEFRRIFDVNYFGAVIGLQCVIPGMARDGGGNVVMISSVNALWSEQHLAAYNSSKAALLQLAKSTALDYAHLGIRVNAVCPTTVDTPLLQEHLSSVADPRAAMKRIVQRHPLGRIPSVEEVASAVTFLASDAASAITGCALPIDCGLSLSADYDRPSLGGVSAFSEPG